MRPFLLHTNLRVLRRSKPMVGMLAFAVVIILGMRRRPPDVSLAPSRIKVAR